MTIVAAQFEQPWGSGSEVCTTGNVFVPGPGGITPPDDTTDLTPTFIIPSAPSYKIVHTVTIEHNAEAIQFANFTIETNDGSVCWTLNATGGSDLFERFATAEQAIVTITIDGQEWKFIVEGVRRSRQFPAGSTTLTGRSLTMLAADPYSFVQNWVNTGPITAAQIVDQAQDYTEIEVLWSLEDWLVPERVWYFTGTPMAVAQRVAESVNAIVISSRNEKAISIVPRYPALPHEWPTTPPDVEIHVDAVMMDSYERADRPAYNAIMVSGQQQGMTARVFLAGTAADKLAPLVTDLLLTDVEGLRQRGMAELGGAGSQAIVTETLPVITADLGPGVLEVGQLCHMVGDGPEWWGLVRGVRVAVQLPSVLQQVIFERHTGTIEGTVVPVVPVDTPSAGVLSKTLANATLSATGSLTSRVGSLSKTLGNATLVATGEHPVVTPVDLGATFHVGFTDESLLSTSQSSYAAPTADGNSVYGLGPPSSTPSTAIYGFGNVNGVLARNTTPNGKPSLYNTTQGCNASSWAAAAFVAYKTGADLWTAAGWTHIICMKVTALSVAGSVSDTWANPAFWDAGDFNRCMLTAYSDGAGGFNVRGYAYDGTEDLTPVESSLSFDVWRVYTLRHLSGNMQLRVNAGSWHTVAHGNTADFAGAGNSGMRIGAYSGNRVHGYRGHHACFNTGLSDTDCLSIEQYMAADIGITI